MSVRFIFLGLLFLIKPFCSQTKLGKSQYEIMWAIIHPYCALKVHKIYHQNLRLFDLNYLKDLGLTDSCDGKTDAFRHVFFMALFSQKCNGLKIYKLGIAHEKKNYECFLNKNCREDCPSDTLSIKMDLQNNQTGIVLGKTFKTLSPEMIRSIVVDLILKGKVNWVTHSPDGRRILIENSYYENDIIFGKKKLRVLRKFKIRKNNPAI